MENRDPDRNRDPVLTQGQQIAVSIDSSLNRYSGRLEMKLPWRDGLYMIERFRETDIFNTDLEDWYRDEIRAEFEYVYRDS